MANEKFNLLRRLRILNDFSINIVLDFHKVSSGKTTTGRTNVNTLPVGAQTIRGNHANRLPPKECFDLPELTRTATTGSVLLCVPKKS